MTISSLPSPRVAPRLLVSVRSAHEAQSAIAGGCDLLDVKEPDRGPLGMADLSVIAAAIKAAKGFPQESDSARDRAMHSLAVSAALGEAADWRIDQPIPSLPAGLHFAKLGLAGASRANDGVDHWRRIRQEFARHAPRSLQWVAVAYADWELAGAPDPEKIIAAAAEESCAAVLFDTWSKRGKTLFDLVSPGVLAGWIDLIHRAGMEAAIAGGLQIGTLPRVASLRPDIVGIRGAACQGGERRGALDELAVRQFRAALHHEAAATRCA